MTKNKDKKNSHLKNLPKIQVNNESLFKKELFRKLIHISSLWIPTVIYFCPQFVAMIVLLIFLLGDMILEYGNYKKLNWARKSFGFLFVRILRNKESSHKQFQFTGAVYVFTSALVCLYAFSPAIAALSMTVMLISDTFAAIVGSSVGKLHIHGRKTLEGTLAFLFSALFICWIFSFLGFVPLTYKMLVACLVATLAELYEDVIRIDDNFIVPLIIGVLLTV